MSNRNALLLGASVAAIVLAGVVGYLLGAARAPDASEAAAARGEARQAAYREAVPAARAEARQAAYARAVPVGRERGEKSGSRSAAPTARRTPKSKKSRPKKKKQRKKGRSRIWPGNSSPTSDRLAPPDPSSPVDRLRLVKEQVMRESATATVPPCRG